MAHRRPAEVHGIVCVDKPLGWTSRDVVNKLTHLMGERRAGHAGTLDPDASGVLVVAFGEATKSLRWLMDAPKTYETTVRFGTATATDDASGPVVRSAPLPQPWTFEAVLAALPQPGVLNQVPPAVSALQRGGVRDHVRVRRGEVVERPPREVQLQSIELLGLEGPHSAQVRLTCGAGFYVRSLARDLGESLGSAAHVVTLRRVSASGFAVADGVSMDTLKAETQEERLEHLLSVVTVLGRVLPIVRVDAAMAAGLRQGKTPLLPDGAMAEAGEVARPAEVLVLDGEGAPVCVAMAAAGEPVRLQVVRGFVAGQTLNP